MAVKKSPGGRKSVYSEPLTERVQVLFTGTQIEELTTRFEGHELSTVLREVMLGERPLDLAAEEANVKKPKETSSPSSESFYIEFDKESARKLEELSKVFGYPDVQHLVQLLATRATNKTPEQIHGFLFGDVFTNMIEEAKKLAEEHIARRKQGSEQEEGSNAA